jgi:hypothetical protein
MWGSHWTIGLEKRGIPSVYVVDEPFVEDVKTTLEKEGMPALRTVVVPHPCGTIPDDQYPGIIPKLIDALTLPLTAKEKQTGLILNKRQGRTTIAGTLDEVQNYFYEHRWSDGLPIIPPTDEKVKEMLKGTSHSQDEVVTTKMWPEGWKVTVEKVGIVGAMAGCIPEYMPVLLAIIEAWGNSPAFESTVRSTTSFAFPILVNGPIRNQIKMNAGTNALGPGNRANATVGRFLRLAIINLGGSWPGVSDMSSQGNTAKYSFCFPENEEQSPWEPFHVSMGYKREDSTVSIFQGGHTHLGNWPQLDRIAQGSVAYTIGNGVMVLLDPLPAKELAEKGLSKQDIEEFIASHSVTTKKDIEFKQGHYYEDTIRALQKAKLNPSQTQNLRWPINFLELPDDSIIKPYPREIVKVIVVGGGTNSFAQTWLAALQSTANIDKWR